MNRRKLSKTKAVCSVTEMAQSIGLSRARFYQLQRENIFPHPLYDIRTRRPFFDVTLQEMCHEVRETGIGCNGNYILFYSPRKNISGSSQKGSGLKSRRGRNSQYSELVDTLGQMGLDVAPDQVQEAVAARYPDGIENEDQGVVIREIFRFLKKR